MDNKTIETLTICKLSSVIVKSDYLEPIISQNDKEPSWDGHVYIYQNPNKNKTDLRRVAIQVKGTNVNDLTKETITFPVKIADLHNYLHDGGVIYFVVYVSSDRINAKIYYSTLTPIKIRSILKDSTIGQKDKSIVLTSLPEDKDDILSIFINFLNHSKKQHSFADASLFSVEELIQMGICEGITTDVIRHKDADPIEALLNSDTQLYAKIKGFPIPQPLELSLIPIETITEIESAVTIKGKLFYNNYTLIHKKDSKAIRIGESFTITFYKNSLNTNINYSQPKMLHAIIKDLEFLIELSKSYQFEINGNIFPIHLSSENTLCNKSHEECFVYCTKISMMFKMLGVDEDVDMSELSDLDYRHIDQLVTSFVDKKPVSGLKAELPSAFTLDVARFKIALIFVPVGDSIGTYNIYDYFKSTGFRLLYKDENNNTIITSRYSILTDSDFINIPNIDFSELLPSFQNLENNYEKYTQANLTLMNLLKAYDLCKKTVILDTALELANWLMNAGGSSLSYDYRLLNLLQTIRRQRQYNYKENVELLSLIEDPLKETEVLVAAHLLLGNQTLAENYFKKLDTKGKEEFKHYPIYTFWKSTS